MSIPGFLVQNYRLYSYLILAASALGGFVVLCPLAILIFRRHLSHWLARDLQALNERLKNTNAALTRENIKLRGDMAVCRAERHAEKIKAIEGAKLVMAAYGPED